MEYGSALLFSIYRSLLAEMLDLADMLDLAEMLDDRKLHSPGTS